MNTKWSQINDYSPYKQWQHLLSSKRRYKGDKIDDKVFTKCWSIWNTVDIATLGAKVRILQIVEENKSKQKEQKYDRKSHWEEAELFEPIPLPESDVRHKDEGG